MIGKPSRALRMALALSSLLVVIACVGSATAGAAQWYTGTNPEIDSVLTGKESVTVTTAAENSHPFEHGKSGSKGVHYVVPALQGPGTELVIEAPAVECVGCSIENSTSGAIGEGRLKFKEAKATSYGCGGETVSLTAGPISLNWELITVAGKQYIKYVSPNGPSKSVVQFSLCAGGFNSFGSFGAEPWTPLSKAGKTHNFTLSKQVDESSGLGIKGSQYSAGWFEGSLTFSLASGKYWYAK
jgi:hypothetical protein